MKEIEVLVEVYDDILNIKRKFEKFNYEGLKETIDEYYYDPKRDTLKPDKENQLSHCLRLRSKNDNYFITYGRLCPQPNHQKFLIFYKKSKPPLEIVCQNSIITVTCSNAQSN